MALAGLPPSVSLRVGEGVELDVRTVEDLRALQSLPHPLEVGIPFRLEEGASVVINRASAEPGERG